MAVVDAAGKPPRGGNYPDLVAYLQRSKVEGRSELEIKQSTCGQCERAVFYLHGDPDAGAVRLVCATCKAGAFIGNSAENWANAAPRRSVCACGGMKFEVAVGLSRCETGAVQGISVATRCVKCGIMNRFADWRVDDRSADRSLEKA